MMLFVCDRNSSLSPMAEAICRDLFPQYIIQSAGLRTSHVRPLVKEVLREVDIDDFGLLSKDIFSVDLTEVSYVIGLGMPDSAWRLPRRFAIEWWVLPDPSCFSKEDQLDGYRALRDELQRRIQTFVSDKPSPL